MPIIFLLSTDLKPERISIDLGGNDLDKLDVICGVFCLRPNIEFIENAISNIQCPVQDDEYYLHQCGKQGICKTKTLILLLNIPNRPS